MGAGDLIFNTGEEITYVYGPAFADIAVFWSPKPLPAELTSGLGRALVST
jgi:hypothetical protein